MMMATDIYKAVAALKQNSDEIAKAVKSRANPARNLAEIVALEKDIEITRNFFDAMDEPQSNFRGMDHLDADIADYPTPLTLAETVESFEPSIIDEQPFDISVSLIDRLLMVNDANSLKRHLGLINHPRFLTQTLYVRAIMAIRAGQWEAGFKELELLRTFAPHSREVLHWLGRYYMQVHHLVAAEHFDAELSFQDTPWTRRSVDAAAIITAHEDYRGYTIQFRGGEYVAVDLGKQRIVDLNNTRATVVIRILINEIIFRIRRRMGITRAEVAIKSSHLHEVMTAIDQKLDN